MVTFYLNCPSVGLVYGENSCKNAFEEDQVMLL